MRNLVSIQRVLDIQPIEGADKIEVATILGWHVVVLKDQFKVGDDVVYAEVDTIMPDKPEFEFLKNSQGNMQRIRTIRLRKQISQGIVFPDSILPPGEYMEDQDVTEIIGATKYEPKLPANLRGEAKGLFPEWIPKSDETRVQNLQRLLNDNKGVRCYVTEKLDGTSFTCYLKDGVFGVCSRNIDLKETENNLYWNIARLLDFEDKLWSVHDVLPNIMLQGELIGEGIQKNKYDVKGYSIRFFNVFNIDTQEYLQYQQFVSLMDKLRLRTVPILEDQYLLSNDIDSIVKMATGKSALRDIQREGLVIRPITYTCANNRYDRISFKAINPEFLLKYKDS